MRARSFNAPTRTVPRRAPYTVDIVLLAPKARRLTLLLARSDRERAKERWLLPCDGPRRGETVETTARRHLIASDVSVCFVGVVPAETAAIDGHVWHGVTEHPPLPPRQTEMVTTALNNVRDRMDYAPVAFRLLPESFTLSELQQMYELLLGRRLHKASFRRSLQASWLVEPTDEWRSEGRGRPAQPRGAAAGTDDRSASTS
jgi:ADP-ribose pyrophosphatase YjhB (NUDIX family)